MIFAAPLVVFFIPGGQGAQQDFMGFPDVWQADVVFGSINYFSEYCILLNSNSQPMARISII